MATTQLNGKTFPDLISENKKTVTILLIALVLLLMLVGGGFTYIIYKKGFKGAFGDVHIQIGGINDTLSRANANAQLLKNISTQLASKMSDPNERDKYLEIASKADEVLASTNGMKERLAHFEDLPPEKQESLLRQITKDYGLSVDIASKLNFGIVDKYLENEDLKDQLKILQLQLDKANEEIQKLTDENNRKDKLAKQNYGLYEKEKNRADSISSELDKQRDSTKTANSKAKKEAENAQEEKKKADETKRTLDKTMPFSVSNLTIEKTRITNDKKTVVSHFKLKSGIKGSIILTELTNKVDISLKQLEVVISNIRSGGIMPVSDPYIVPIEYNKVKNFQISTKKGHFTQGQYYLDLYLISGSNRSSIYHIELEVR